MDNQSVQSDETFTINTPIKSTPIEIAIKNELILDLEQANMDIKAQEVTINNLREELLAQSEKSQVTDRRVGTLEATIETNKELLHTKITTIGGLKHQIGNLKMEINTLSGYFVTHNQRNAIITIDLAGEKKHIDRQLKRQADFLVRSV